MKFAQRSLSVPRFPYSLKTLTIPSIVVHPRSTVSQANLKKIKLLDVSPLFDLTVE